MRASIVIASFAALAASSPVNVPVLGNVEVPDVAQGITAHPVDAVGGVVKREITTLPLFVVSNLPINASKLPVDVSSLPADVLSLVDLQKLPVDVTGLPTDVLNLIGDLLNLLDLSKLPINVANLPSAILDIVGDVTDILDISKIPVDVSKLSVLSSTANTATNVVKRDLGNAIDPVLDQVKNTVPVNTLPVKRGLLDLPVIPSLSLPEASKVNIEDILHQVTDLLTSLLESDSLPTKGLGVSQNTTDAVGLPILETIELAATIKAVLNIVTGLLG
ncbi:hypothetical protein T440DRAFT_471598 [Plenodomus tracheiphilus IPT5]|uniref:Uncharacterized protein n=1 Tax=Plenodomus tracheiphilus IPT5 TaxID=1408161 RepID=A0A6A7ATR9_9PLEO|nr:hypothetical protein T440DRAFT_471598 [Plenodomus tracheiphilus IPT5]